MPPFEKRIQEIGLEIFERSQESQMGLFDKGYWSGKMMEWSMENPAFKVEMFRFVDVLPSLTNSEQVVEHLRQYFLRPGLELSPFIRAGLGAASLGSIAGKLAAGSIRKNVESMASMFITGSSASTARPALQKLWNNGFCFTVDILGEAALSEKEAEEYQRKYLDLVTVLAEDVKTWKSQPLLETPNVPRANVSVKCSSLYSQVDSAAFRASVDAIKNRLRPILVAAKDRGVFVNLDMEQNDYRELLLSVAEELFMEPELRAYPHFGVVIQAYLKCAEADLDRVIALARKRETPVTIRLVKGAYWDYEVIQSLQKDWPLPVFANKADTDANYERCAKKIIDAHPRIGGAFASHNVRSLAVVMAYAEERGLKKTDLEVQMLYGMAEPFKKAVTNMGYRVREYAPVGEMLPGMAYLVRRLLENTSNEGFLRAKFVSGVESARLLADPAALPKTAKVQSLNEKIFKNESLTDFGISENREAIEKSLSALRAKFPIVAKAVVGGKVVEGLPENKVYNPSQLSELVTQHALSTEELAQQAVEIANTQGRAAWSARPVAERVEVLRRAAQLMREDKNSLTALMVLEVGKNFREADADVAEAIDFCVYYAAEMERLAGQNPSPSFAGESNQYAYRPRGTTVAIAPWNFPFAILCGLTVGPLVAGNPVLMKPSEQSTAIGKALFDILLRAGVAPEALHFLPGAGSVVGRALVKSPGVHVINFTGSREVGLEIMSEASRLAPGQKHLKKVVAELGGKNALIVDEDADLDEAVVGTLQSAFGFQGQKCSALSRVIVLESCFDKFKQRLQEAMLSMKIGPSENPAHKIGPVIEQEARERLEKVIERNRAKIIAQLELSPALKAQGHFVAPTLFEESDPNSELGQQEFFGPLLTLFKVKDFDAAIRLANGTDYALTGGLFSRSPQNIERVRNELEVGNLYINRGITGALVCRQPFGGYKLSGVGAKAGGPDYLLQFLEPRSITENTMRRGFAPEI